MQRVCIVVGACLCVATGCVSTTSLNEDPRDSQVEPAVGLGVPRFAPSVWSDVPTSDGLLVGAWNGADSLDVLLLARPPSVAVRMSGLGDGLFEDGQVLHDEPHGLVPGTAQRADVDGDGLDDFLALSTLTGHDEPRLSRLTALLQRTGGFAVRTLDFPGGAAALTLSDLDGDGVLDALVASDGAAHEPDAVGSLRVLQGLGDGRFVPGAAPTPIAGLRPCGLVVRSNGLSGREIALWGVAGGETAVARFDLSALEALRPLRITTAPTEPAMIVPVMLRGIPQAAVWADLDDDGRDDLVLAAPAERALHVVLADARRLSIEVEDDAYELGANLAVGDLNDDGLLDLVLPASVVRDTDGDGAGPAVLVLYGEGAGTFATQRLLQLGRERAFGERVFVADMNADGQNDLLLSTARGDGPGARLGVSFGPFSP